MPTADEILEAAERVLRQYGPEKATVVDVAQELDVSHSALYRHYSSKKTLWEAVTRRWLRRIERPLASIAAEDGPAEERLYRWISTLISTKRETREDDPELFATYYALAENAEGVVSRHVEELLGQLSDIISDGVASGTFDVEDSGGAARAVFDATSRFHHPARAKAWDRDDVDEHVEFVWHLVRRGLSLEP